MARSRNPAEIRGDIQRGLTGDKRPGFDPAASPLETDAEAGGTTLSQEQIELALGGQSAGSRPIEAGTYGNAMRRQSQAPGAGRSRVLLIVCLTAVGLVAAVAAVITAGS